MKPRYGLVDLNWQATDPTGFKSPATTIYGPSIYRCDAADFLYVPGIKSQFVCCVIPFFHYESIIKISLYIIVQFCGFMYDINYILTNDIRHPERSH